jgi:hypothetical protein
MASGFKTETSAQEHIKALIKKCESMDVIDAEYLFSIKNDTISIRARRIAKRYAGNKFL